MSSATAERVYTSTELAEAAGISYRQAEWWTRRGYLQPDETHPGSGFARSYTATEVQVATLITRLTDAGLTVETAAARARNLHRHSWDVIQEAGLIITLQLTGGPT